MENILMTSIPVPELVIQIANEIESRIQKPTPSEPLPERMTIDEVTKFTGLSKSWIYKETAKKSIPLSKMGGTSSSGVKSWHGWRAILSHRQIIST
ncbi:MAG: hypothetical protein IPI37_10495 [Bacteroidales bacterium]|nr:hypothetical protein [Bacteroidales bacterium]